MFQLNEFYQRDSRFLKCESLCLPPSKLGTIKTARSQIYNNKARKIPVIYLLNSSVELIFDVVQDVTGNRYADGNNERLFILGPIAVFS